MYKFLFILFSSFSLQFNSQINTQLLSNTSWTCVNSIMIDGSRDLSFGSNQYLVWKIKGNNLCVQIDPWFIETTKCVNYKIDNNLMKLSDKSNYEIETLTPDSLVVIQKIDGKNFPDQIKKMMFVKTSVLVRNFTDKETSDSIEIISRNVTPTLTKEIITEITDTYFNKKYIHDFMVDGEIRIFPKKQEVDVKINNNKQNKENQRGIDLFKATLKKNYKSWDISGYEKFEKIIIPLIIKSKMEEGYGNVGFNFKNSNQETNRNAIAVKIKNKSISMENFNKGLNAVNSQKYDNAIYFFNKAHEEDNTNIESLYNVASISLAQNNTNVACVALKRLKELEQTQGTQLFKEKCLK